MKRKTSKILALGLAVLMLATPAHATSAFPDVDENASYAEAAEYLNEIGIMQGDEKGNFNPDKAVSRAEMAAIICRMLGETENLTTSTIFADVPVSHWANGYIAKAASLGIISGYGNGKFGPSDSVTYEQALTMVVRSLELEENALEAGGYPAGYISVAQEYGFTYQLSAKAGDLMLRWQVAIILYNTQV